MPNKRCGCLLMLAAAVFFFCLFYCLGWSKASFRVAIYHNGDINNHLGQFFYDKSQCEEHNSVDDYLWFRLSSDKRQNGMFLNEIGLQITLCQEIQPSIFFLPSNRLFIWPGFELGHRVTLPDIVVPEVHDPVSLLTISVKPRIFVVDNLISNRESDFLIHYVSNKSSEEDGLDVSLVGDAVLSSVRTSYNGWDSESTVAVDLIGRCMELLRVYRADESYFEKIQIARYHKSQYYDLHFDYYPANEPSLGGEYHDWDIAGNGTNRFLTVLFYLSEVALGGETIFPLAEEWWDENKNASVSNLDGWKRDRTLFSSCKEEFLKFSPKKLRALLFYSQTPYRELDSTTRHGSCPVQDGEKWIATIWMWNGPRSTPHFNAQEPLNQKSSMIASKPESIIVMFSLSDEFLDVTADIRLLDPLQEVAGVFHKMKPLIVNSQEGATWTVVVFLDSNESLVINKIVIKPISIGGKLQRYVISLLEVTSGYS